MLIQAKTNNEAKLLLVLFASCFVVNFAVFVHAFQNQDIPTLIFCAIAGVLALVMTIQMKTQLSADNYNKQKWK